MTSPKEIISQFAEQWAIMKAAPYPFVVVVAVATGAVVGQRVEVTVGGNDPASDARLRAPVP
jgi:hypothetical protein